MLCFRSRGPALELRHLRYFVAVAEARSLKLAAEEETAYHPAVAEGRQIRDLENEVGTPLFLRGSKGVALTLPAAFSWTMRVSCFPRAETAVQSVRQVVHPTKPLFALGFMIGQDSTWLPETSEVAAG